MHEDRKMTRGKYATTGKGMKTFAQELENEMSEMGIQTFLASEVADDKVKQITPLTAVMMTKMNSLLKKQKKDPEINI
jgi:hypothetical protein